LGLILQVEALGQWIYDCRLAHWDTARAYELRRLDVV
jgi:hypothetical protein